MLCLDQWFIFYIIKSACWKVLTHTHHLSHIIYLWMYSSQIIMWSPRDWSLSQNSKKYLEIVSLHKWVLIYHQVEGDPSRLKSMHACRIPAEHPNFNKLINFIMHKPLYEIRFYYNNYELLMTTAKTATMQDHTACSCVRQPF